MAQSPAYTWRAVGLAINHDLCGAARSVLARQIEALLNNDSVVVSIKVPNIPVWQQQHGAMSVSEAGGARAGMEVKPNREVILCVRWQSGSGDRQENVFTVEPVAIS